MAIFYGLTEAEAESIAPQKHVWRDGHTVTVLTGDSMPNTPMLGQLSIIPSVGGVEVSDYYGDGGGLQAALFASVAGVRIMVGVTFSATIVIPAGKAVVIDAGVTACKTGGGTDAFSAAGGGSKLIGPGTVTGGRYAFNSAGYNDTQVRGVTIRKTVLHGVFLAGGQRHTVDLCDISAGQSGIAAVGISASELHSNYINDCGNFGLWLSGGSHSNHISKNRCDVSGLELIGITYDCHDNHIYGNKARNTGDNGISVTGYRNVVTNNECSGNKNHGIGIYGERNTVVGNYGKNNGRESLSDGGQYAGITCTPAFGGLARKNVIVGNYFDDDQPLPTQHCTVKIATDAYVAWAAGQVVANSNLYRKSGAAIYHAASPGTTGPTAPTHASGDVSDGGVTWRWVCSTVNSLARNYQSWASGVVVTDANRHQSNGRIVYRADAIGGTTGTTAPTHTRGTVSDGGVFWSVYEECPDNLDAYDNTVAGNGGSGNAISDPVLDLTANKQFFMCAGRIRIPEPARNQFVDYICGAGLPNGAVTARPGSLYSRQDVSVQGIALWSKQTGVSDTGWYRVALQDAGSTTQRPELLTYGLGAQGYCYFDETIYKPVWWTGVGWVDAAGVES